MVVTSEDGNHLVAIFAVLVAIKHEELVKFIRSWGECKLRARNWQEEPFAPHMEHTRLEKSGNWYRSYALNWGWIWIYHVCERWSQWMDLETWNQGRKLQECHPIYLWRHYASTDAHSGLFWIAEAKTSIWQRTVVAELSGKPERPYGIRPEVARAKISHHSNVFLETRSFRK